jgi:uncharacterized membrane protein YvbJ
MALISCQECGRQVSDKASACPQCACPIGALPAGGPRVVTIQETSKRWKKLQLLGMIGVPVCFIGIMSSAGADQPSEGAAVFWVLGLLASIGAYIYGRFGAWWHHR